MTTPTHLNPIVGFNQKRAGWAREAVLTFMAETGLSEDDGYDTAIADLLADLKHLASELQADFSELLTMAEMHHGAETASICSVCQRPHDAEADGSEVTLCIDCDRSSEVA